MNEIPKYLKIFGIINLASWFLTLIIIGLTLLVMYISYGSIGPDWYTLIIIGSPIIGIISSIQILRGKKYWIFVIFILELALMFLRFFEAFALLLIPFQIYNLIVILMMYFIPDGSKTPDPNFQVVQKKKNVSIFIGIAVVVWVILSLISSIDNFEEIFLFFGFEGLIIFIFGALYYFKRTNPNSKTFGIITIGLLIFAILINIFFGLID